MQLTQTSIIDDTAYCCFKLKYPKGSQEAQNFLNAARKLEAIPGVQNFEALRQISKKNDFDFGLSMEFANQNLYDGYSNHPDHQKFVLEYWVKYVKDFLEIDYEPLENGSGK